MKLKYKFYRKRPFKHQVRTLKKALRLNANCALLLDPGCGKTRVAIDFCGIKAEEEGLQRVLIVAPKVAGSVWQDQIAYFLPKRIKRHVIALYTGPIEERRKVLQDARDISILTFVIVNYDIVAKLRDSLRAWGPQVVIADESHFIKHHTAQRSRALVALGEHARWRFILTGTMITNTPLDVFSQYKFLDKNVFGTSWTKFKQRYAKWGGFGGFKCLGYKNLDELRRKVYSIAARASKDELDLPPYTFQEVKLPLSPRTKKVYDQMEKNLIAELDALGTKATASIVLTKLLRLMQITGGFVTDDEGRKVPVGTEKLDALRELLTNYVVEGNSKVVVFAHFIWELEQIALLCKELGIEAINLREVKDETTAKRRFLEDANCRVFIMQLAKGVGINELTAADVGIFYSLDYSSDHFIQSRDRLHRPGQKRHVHYDVLLMEHTLDTKVYRRLRNNQSLAESIVDWKKFLKEEED